VTNDRLDALARVDLAVTVQPPGNRD